LTIRSWAKKDVCLFWIYPSTCQIWKFLELSKKVICIFETRALEFIGKEVNKRKRVNGPTRLCPNCRRPWFWPRRSFLRPHAPPTTSRCPYPLVVEAKVVLLSSSRCWVPREVTCLSAFRAAPCSSRNHRWETGASKRRGYGREPCFMWRPHPSKGRLVQSRIIMGAISEVMMHNTSHIRFKHMKCSES
jgi:hypothetical protein